MAEITGDGGVGSGGSFKFTWNNLGNGDTGKPISAGKFAEHSVQITGTFGSGGTVALEGSNDGGTTWGALHDAQGNAISVSDNDIASVAEYTEQIRPHVTAGDGSTDVHVHVVARKPV